MYVQMLFLYRVLSNGKLAPQKENPFGLTALTLNLSRDVQALLRESSDFVIHVSWEHLLTWKGRIFRCEFLKIGFRVCQNI